jgi:hypothetical protein
VTDPHPPFQDPRSSRDRRDDASGRHDDVDPTGVRAILSALPDPGPMPADLVQRINASLDAERLARPVQRAAAPASVGPSGSVGPSVGGRLPEPSGAHSGRSGLGRRLPSLALAASLVVLAGVVVLGVLGTIGLGSGSDGDSAMDTMVSERGDSGGADGGAGAESDATLESGPLSDGDEGVTTMSAGIPMLATGALVSRTTLAGHARDLRDDDTLVHDESSAAVMAVSPVGTPEGAADCLGLLIGLPPTEAQDRVAAVDFVRFEDAPAALLLVRDDAGSDDAESDDPAARLAQASTAYLVPVDCGASDARALVGPVRVDL